MISRCPFDGQHGEPGGHPVNFGCSYCRHTMTKQQNIREKPKQKWIKKAKNGLKKQQKYNLLLFKKVPIV